ncbi:MAG: hypothetical protein U0931_31255 [Vulcanimicrobiota bacterium]
MAITGIIGTVDSLIVPRPKIGAGTPINTISTTVTETHLGGFVPSLPADGFVLDTNGNGKYERGADPVLAFDLNHDNKIDNSEVARSNAILNSVNQPTLPNGQPNQAYAQARELGLTGGPLSADQLANAGARVVTDTGSGGDHQWSTSSVYNFPLGNGQRGSLDSINPAGGFATPRQVW